MAIQQHVNLKPYNSFGVSATAAWFASVHNPIELSEALLFAGEQGLPLLILGGGSNTLFVHDFPGLVLHMQVSGVQWLGQGQVRAGAGENWHNFVIQCMRQNLHGLENLALIPGTVGAAPFQNIGAYGVELADFVVDVSALDTETSQLVTLDRSACEFAYRDSLFKSESPPRHIILSLRLQLSSGWAPRLDYPALQQALTEAGIVNPDPQQLFDTVCQIRRSKLPDPALLGNAGSFFKNPLISIEKLEQLRQRFADLPYYPSESAGLVKIPAAWLLDQLGWKGRSRGNAAVHSEHALVLVNPGQATGEDILLLAQAMSSAVLSEFGIALQPEVRIL